MSGSVEIVLWLHEYESKALKKQLASNGTDVEKRMQEMLADLYSECVPFEERQAIQELINAEHAEAVADQMANTTWAVFQKSFSRYTAHRRKTLAYLSHRWG